MILSEPSGAEIEYCKRLLLHVPNRIIPFSYTFGICMHHLFFCLYVRAPALALFAPACTCSCTVCTYMRRLLHCIDLFAPTPFPFLQHAHRSYRQSTATMTFQTSRSFPPWSLALDWMTLEQRWASREKTFLSLASHSPRLSQRLKGKFSHVVILTSLLSQYHQQ